MCPAHLRLSCGGVSWHGKRAWALAECCAGSTRGSCSWCHVFTQPLHQWNLLPINSCTYGRQIEKCQWKEGSWQFVEVVLKPSDSFIQVVCISCLVFPWSDLSPGTAGDLLGIVSRASTARRWRNGLSVPRSPSVELSKTLHLLPVEMFVPPILWPVNQANQ